MFTFWMATTFYYYDEDMQFPEVLRRNVLNIKYLFTLTDTIYPVIKGLSVFPEMQKFGSQWGIRS